MFRFEVLIERHHDELYRYLWRMTGGSTDNAADLSQETWLRAWGAFDRLRPDSNARAWLYRIATNCALNAMRRQGREVALKDDGAVADESWPPEEQMEQGELLEKAQEEIDLLPPRQRAAVLLRYGQELQYTKVAAAMRCSEENARALVSLGIRRLRRELEESIA